MRPSLGLLAFCGLSGRQSGIVSLVLGFDLLVGGSFGGFLVGVREDRLPRTFDGRLDGRNGLGFGQRFQLAND